MDRQLLERMVGAGVLVLALVIIAPAVLDGDRNGSATPVPSARAPAEADPERIRQHTIRLDREPERPPVPRKLVDVKPAPQPEAKPEPKPEPKPAPEPEPKPAPKPEPKPESRPAPEPAPAKVAQPAPAPVKAATRSGWAVQLAAFSREDTAQKLADQVQGGGFDSYLVAVKRADKTLYRVRVGAEDTRERAGRLAERLAAAGHDGGQVVKIQPES